MHFPKFTLFSAAGGYETSMSSAPTPDTSAPIVAWITAILDWMARCVIGAAAALAAHIVVNPAVVRAQGFSR
jgi:hypothetical protein